MTARQSCSGLSLSLAEPLFATASEASAWLLVEQPGPWGHDALAESGLDRQVAEELQQRTKELGVKALLIKRPGRSSHGRGCLLGWSGQGSAFLERVELAAPAELLDLDLEALARGDRPRAGTRVTEPLYLVCTNSRRDACCARLGRPLAAALADAYGERVWECSHLGGHRFAANLVCLPDGLWFGRAEPGVAADYEQGRIALTRFRGRSSFPAAAQAADYFLRERDGLHGLDDVAVEAVNGTDVTLRVRGRRVHVRVERDDAHPPRPISCGEEKLDRPAVWSLVSVRAG